MMTMPMPVCKACAPDLLKQDTLKTDATLR